MKALCTFIALAVIVISDLAHADSATHCKSDETNFFTCSIANSRKVVSICGDRNEETKKISWLQYRFGVIGSPELIYPASKAGSFSKFYSAVGLSNEGRYQQYNIWFRIGAYWYTVSTAEYGEDKTEFAADVRYIKSTSTVTGRRTLEHGGLSCSQPSPKLMDSLGVLGRVLPHRELLIEN